MIKVVFTKTFRLTEDCVISNAEIQMPNECQEPNANGISLRRGIAIRLHMRMVIMVLGFTWHLILWILSFVQGAVGCFTREGQS